MVDTQMDLTKLTATQYNKSMRDIDKFCRKYEAQVREGKYAMRRPQPMTSFFDFKDDASMFRSEYMTAHEVKTVEVFMPEDRFHNLVELERRISDIEDDLFQIEQLTRTRGRGWLENLMEKERRESFIRQSNPAVKKAYENYSMLLNMVKDQYR